MNSSVLAGLLWREPFRPFSFVLGDNTEVHKDGATRCPRMPAHQYFRFCSQGETWEKVPFDQLPEAILKAGTASSSASSRNSVQVFVPGTLGV
jgi:hypothetical protein